MLPPPPLEKKEEPLLLLQVLRASREQSLRGGSRRGEERAPVLLKVPSNPETLRLCGPILAISVCILAWRLTPVFAVYMPGKTCHFHRRGARTCWWLGFITMLIAPVWSSSVGPISWDSAGGAQTPLGLCEPRQGCHGLGLRWTLPRSASDTLRFTPQVPQASGVEGGVAG